MKPPLRLIRGGAASPEEMESAELLRALPSQSPEDVSIERVWRGMSQRPARSTSKLWIPVAALAAVLLAVMLSTRQNAGVQTPTPELVLQSQHYQLLRLPGIATLLVKDGEIVSESTEAGTRLLLRSGQVTAKVSKRTPEDPFVIQAGQTSVRVVGTLFTVEFNRGVSVHEGKVEVTQDAFRKTLVTAGHRWNPEGADETPETVVQLLEAALKGEPIDQLRGRFDSLEQPPPAPPTLPTQIPPQVVLQPVHKPVVMKPVRIEKPEPTLEERAAQLESQGDFAGEAEALEAAINRSPERSELLVRLGRLEMQRLNDPSRAVEAFQRYRKQFPQGPLMEVVDLSMVEIRIGQGDDEETLKELSRFINRHSTSERVDEMRVRRGHLLTERGDWGLALADFRSVQSPRQLDEAMFLTIACEQHIGQAEGAKSSMHAYLQRFPSGRHATEVRKALGGSAP